MSDSRVEVKPNMKSRVGCHTRRRFMACTGPDGGVGELLETRSGQGGMEWLCSKCQCWHLDPSSHSAGFVPFWHENLGHAPVYVDSWKTYRQALAAVSPHARNGLAS